MKTVKSSLKQIRRNPYQAVAAIFIIAQTFFVITVFAFIIFGSAKILTYVESLPQVTAFFKDDATQANIDDLKSQINATGKIAQMRYVSKEEALVRYKSMFKSDPILLELVTADFLPASFEISTNKIEDLQVISDILSKSSYIDKVIYPKEVVNGLSDWTRVLRKIGTVLVIIMTLDSIFVMTIIIGIKIGQKREEIEIMRLLSATNWYVIRPFINEGIIYGITGAVIGWGLGAAGLFSLSPTLEAQPLLRGITLLPVSPVFLMQLLTGELLIAIVLGMLSSSVAVLRYLK